MQLIRDNIRPRFATRNRSLLAAALQRLRDFWRDYGEILAEHKKNKNHAAVFPAGSYAVRRFLGLPVHSFT